MLDTTATIVLLLGAVFITLVGAAANYATQSDGNKVNVKTVSRDFVIGLALSSVAYFVIPDSFHSLGKSIQEVKLPELSGGGVQDIDLHVGPARF
jgi:hypothetical protein